MTQTRVRWLALIVVLGVGSMGLTAPTVPAAEAVIGSAPAAGLPDSATTTRFVVDGVPVILRRNTANDVVVANLYLLGGTRQLTPQTAGIEAMLLLASERGTRRYPGAMARQRAARLGSSITLEANDDWSEIGLHAIRGSFDSTWSLLADRVIAPSLVPSEVELIREQMLTAARQRGEQPDDEAARLADSLLYQHHPYAISTTGTPTSLAAITVADLRRYHDQQFVTSRMLLVVVGNVDRAHLERLIHGTLARLPRGVYRWTSPPPLPSGDRAIAFDSRPLPTNYLLGYAPGPAATDPDYTALRVATAVLSGRLFTEVRSRRNLSYAVESPFLEQAYGVGGLYVTTVDPNAVLGIMRAELSALQTDQVEAEGLKRLEQQFITEYYLKNETNADQANELARAELYQGDYREADRLMENLRRVTPADVERVARKYLVNFRFAYVGDTTKVDRALLERF
jgi:zinc protease